MKYLISASGGINGQEGLVLLVCYSTPRADRDHDLPKVLYRGLPEEHIFSGKRAALLLSHYADGSLSIIGIQGQLKVSVSRSYDTLVCYQVSNEDLESAEYKIGRICATIPRGRLKLYDAPQRGIEPLSAEPVPDIGYDQGQVHALVILLKFAIWADYQLLISLPDEEQVAWYADGVLMHPISHALWHALDELPLYLRNRATFALSVDESYPQTLIGDLRVILHHVPNLSASWSKTRHLNLDWQTIEREAEQRRQIVETYEALLSHCSLPEEYGSIDRFTDEELQKSFRQYVRQVLRGVILPTQQDYKPYKCCVLVEDKQLGVTQEEFVSLWLEERLKALENTDELWKSIQELKGVNEYQSDQVLAMASREASEKFLNELLGRKDLSPEILNNLYKRPNVSHEKLREIVEAMSEEDRQELCSGWSWSEFKNRLLLHEDRLRKGVDYIEVWSIVKKVKEDCIEDWYRGYTSMFKAELSKAMWTVLNSECVDKENVVLDVWARIKTTIDRRKEKLLPIPEDRTKPTILNSNCVDKEKWVQEVWDRTHPTIDWWKEKLLPIPEARTKPTINRSWVCILMCSLVALIIAEGVGIYSFCRRSATHSPQPSVTLPFDSKKVNYPMSCICGCSNSVLLLNSSSPHRNGQTWMCPCIQKKTEDSIQHN